MRNYITVFKVGKRTGSMQLKAIDSGSALNKTWCELASNYKRFRIISVIEQNEVKIAFKAIKNLICLENYATKSLKLKK
jgi:hypothetical protein